MQLSQKQIIFFQFFAAFLKSRINSKQFGKKDDPDRILFLILRTPKTYSDKCVKSPVSEDASTSNMGNVSMHC